MTRLAVALSVLMAAPAWAQRPPCPPADRPDTARDAYLDAHLAYVGSLQDPVAKALDQIEVAKCVVSWCPQPIQPRHRIRAADTLLRAGKHPMTQSKVPPLQARLGACAVAEPAQNGVGWRAITGWSLIGASAAAMGLGLVFQSAADDAAADYDAAIAAEASSTIINRHRDDNAASTDSARTSWIAGGVLAAAGVGLLIWSWTDEAPVRAWATPQGFGIGGRF